MSHTFTKIWIHAIFATKNRTPIITDEHKMDIHRRIVENFEKKDCPVSIINGMPDHVHVLFLLAPDKAIANMIKSVKGETSHWVNRQNMINEKFAWQIGYSAFSVSESHSDVVVEYIRNQVAHHKKRTYQEEVDLFLKNYGLEH